MNTENVKMHTESDILGVVQKAEDNAQAEIEAYLKLNEAKVEESKGKSEQEILAYEETLKAEGMVILKKRKEELDSRMEAQSREIEGECANLSKSALAKKGKVVKQIISYIEG